MSNTQREEARQRRQAEKRRSHLNDPPPKKWNLRNIWVFGQHLPVDWGVILCTVFLTLMGSLMVLSASSYEMGVTGDGNAMSTFITQVFSIALGGVAFVLAANLDYRFLNNRRIVMLLILVSFVMLLLVWLLPKVPAINSLKIGVWSPYLNNAYRWLRIGIKSASISIQPSEILKVAVILYLSYYITHNQKTMHLFWRNNFPALCVVGVNALLVVLQPNLSTTSLIVFVTMFMLVAGGMRKRTLFLLMLAGVAGLVALAYITPGRWERITTFMNPWAEGVYNDEGYQLVQSYYALGNGGWFGTGLGLSKQKHLFLPYAYSDFIYAIVGEELGFVRGVGVLLVFLVLIWCGYRIAVNASDSFGCYLALGLTSILALQVILNIFVVTGFMPTTGIPLPFFTAGGTTMTIFLGTMGLLVSVSRRPVAIKERVAPPRVQKLVDRLRGRER